MNHGVIVLNKPKGPTSAACLNKIKKKFKIKKLGHAGTLDPMATGVMVVLVGQATKIADYVMEGVKTYKGRLQLGLETDTYDIEGIILNKKDFSHVTPQILTDEIKRWESLTSQEVPPVSAAKHKGRPLYELQRAGQKVPVKIKEINIYRADVISIDIPLAEFRTSCSAGTYIRSLAHSLGKRLDCGAVLTELVREQSQPFSLEQSIELDTLLNAEQWQEHVLPIAQALSHWPKLVIDERLKGHVRNGRPTDASFFPEIRARESTMALMVSEDDIPEALVRLEADRDGRLVWTVIRGLWTA